MTLTRLVIRSLRYYWRTAAAVTFGLAVATAVIVGSLAVGDSVRGSIRDSAVSRLGTVNSALISPTFFRDKLASGLSTGNAIVVPLTSIQGAVESAETEAVVPNVSVYGIDDSFSSLFPGSKLEVSERDVAVNAALAKELGVRAGDSILLNVDKQGAVPSGTLFAHSSPEDTLVSLRLTVKTVLSNAGIGGFRLDTGTDVPRSIFISRSWLMAEMGKTGLVNALVTAAADTEALQSVLKSKVQLSDYGLRLVQNPSQGYLALESDSMLMKDALVRKAQAAARASGAKPALTSVYLATSLHNWGRDRTINYAVIAAVEPLRPFPVKNVLGDATPDIWLNTWAAGDLKAKPGDRIDAQFMVAMPDGSYENWTADFIVNGIVDIAGPAADQGLVPKFEGITDAESIADWKPPFPVDLDKVTERDDAYWTKYRTTPKAFISLEDMRRIWEVDSRRITSGDSPGSNAGWVTSVRLKPAAGMSLASLSNTFSSNLLQSMSPEDSGMAFRPVRKQALASAAGTTDFGQLFLAMSIFLVVSGAGLAAMLMRLSTEQRAAETGVMLACGFRQSTAAAVAFAQGALLAVMGTIVGVPAGVFYAWAMIAALRTRWVGAVSTSSLSLHVTPGSLMIGAAAGLVVGALSMWWSARGLRKGNTLQLLSGWQTMNIALPKASGAGRKIIAAIVLIAAAEIVTVPVLGARSPQTAFFLCGAGLLAAGILAAAVILQRAMQKRMSRPSLAGLAVRSAAANRGRSLLVIGLLACASFVIIAVAANTRDFGRSDYTRRDSGTGGFALQAVSSIPIRYDLGSAKGRAGLGFDPGDEELFDGVRVMPFLMSPGDDISCLNIAKPAYPRVVAVSDEMIRRGGFSVSTADHIRSPWNLLLESSGDIPVFGDSNSVVWNLHSGLGKTYTMPGGDGELFQARFDGLLPQSIYAGELLMSEANFRKLFPAVSDPRFFLFEVPRGGEEAVAAALRRNLGRTGFQVRTTSEVLNAYAGVQNTYLSMFLALGGLGIILGTVGMVTVLLRSALERRKEFALMLAQGFGSRSVFRLLLIENAALLMAGLIVGAVSALVAVAPQISSVDARINWLSIVTVFAGIIAAGLASCAVAASGVARGRLIEALRGE